MITLTPKQRRELRAQAHALHPVVSVGQHGLTPSVMHEIDVALRAHALVKVRVFSEDRADREAMLSQIADEMQAAPVQHIGKLLILWRPPEETPAKAKRAKPRKSADRRAKAKTKPRGRFAPDDARSSSSSSRSHGKNQPDAGARDAATARRRRRSTTTTPSPVVAARRSAPREPDAASESTRSRRGKSAPNPRRRRAP